MTDEASRLTDALRALAAHPASSPGFTSTDLGFAVVDDGRDARTGVPEVVYGSGKSPAQVAALLGHLVDRGRPALATRVSPEAADTIRALRPASTYEPVPRLLWEAPTPETAFQPTFDGLVAVCSAGTTDGPVAEEAARVCEWLGMRVLRVVDVGVAGLHRLVDRLPDLSRADVVIAVAGMEGALPSVLTGLVRAPVVAVPTSVGYGTHLGGWTPLLAMLTSCASGLSVVNVDNGFGAAMCARRVLAVRR
jgi:NCAIR mutase (PurE)-related protein